MSDLIKRLRGWPGPRGGEVPYLQTMTEAADEIEKLRAALDAIINYEEDSDRDYCEWYNDLVLIARTAREEKQ